MCMWKAYIRWNGRMSCVLPCRSMTMTGHPTFNQEKLTKRAKRSVGFVLQVGLDLSLLTWILLCAKASE